MGKTLWKSQNVSLNGFFQGKHHPAPAVLALICKKNERGLENVHGNLYNPLVIIWVPRAAWLHVATLAHAADMAMAPPPLLLPLLPPCHLPPLCHLLHCHHDWHEAGWCVKFFWPVFHQHLTLGTCDRCWHWFWRWWSMWSGGAVGWLFSRHGWLSMVMVVKL